MVRFGTGSLYSTILTHYRLDTSGWLGADTSVMGVGLGIQMLSIAAAIIAVIVIGARARPRCSRCRHGRRSHGCLSSVERRCSRVHFSQPEVQQPAVLPRGVDEHHWR